MFFSFLLDINFYASPEFVANTLHLVAFFEVPILMFGGFVILCKTPKEMTPVKWYLFNLHFWIAVSDTLLSYLTVPFILLPVLAGWGLGAVDAPGFLFYCVVTFHAALVASIMAIYENRFNCIYGFDTIWSHIRKPFLAAIYIFIPLFFIPPYFYVPDQELAKEKVKEMLPDLEDFTYNDRKMYILSVDNIVPFYSMFGEAIIIMVVCNGFFFSSLWTIFSKYEVSKSLKTQKLQIRFAIALTFQTGYLFIVIVIPVFTILHSIYFRYHNQALSNMAIVILSTHGNGSTFVMVVVHKPYRDYVLSKVGISFDKKDSQADVSPTMN